MIEFYFDNNCFDFNSIKIILKLNYYFLILKWIYLKLKLNKMYVICDVLFNFMLKKNEIY